ncbi:hypothetical protein G6722_02190 [Polynucleobacter paneuropaeus]|nr:hypothetical protein [Polynucleobacter paneuropaeus]
MACPARFERATYALEAVKMRLNNTKNNDIKVLKSGVASAPRIKVRGGMPWILGGVCRRLDGQMSNLSGKPTFLAPRYGTAERGLLTTKVVMNELFPIFEIFNHLNLAFNSILIRKHVY